MSTKGVLGERDEALLREIYGTVHRLMEGAGYMGLYVVTAAGAAQDAVRDVLDMIRNPPTTEKDLCPGCEHLWGECRCPDDGEETEP